MCVCVCVCVCVCARVHVHTRMSAHTHTHTLYRLIKGEGQCCLATDKNGLKTNTAAPIEATIQSKKMTSFV